jgi:hypothetical protein
MGHVRAWHDVSPRVSANLKKQSATGQMEESSWAKKEECFILEKKKERRMLVQWLELG